MNKALFLDRDGIINEDVSYLHKVEDVRFVDGLFELCKLFQDKGFLLICCTNQSGVARGYYPKEDTEIVHDYMIKEFARRGLTLSKIYTCYHGPEDNCDCRKPKPGMFLSAIKEFNLDPKLCYSIGDKRSDVEASTKADVGHIYLVKSRYNNYEGDYASVRDFYNDIREKLK